MQGIKGWRTSEYLERENHREQAARKPGMRRKTSGAERANHSWQRKVSLRL